MVSLGYVRKIDELGRIVIPKDIRRSFDMEIGNRIEFFKEGNSVIIKKFSKSCEFCSEEEPEFEFGGHMICKKCVEEISKLK